MYFIFHVLTTILIHVQEYIIQ